MESKEVTVRDIARYFGVPLYKLQEGKQAYGSNEQNAIEYVVGTSIPALPSTRRSRLEAAACPAVAAGWRSGST